MTKKGVKMGNWKDNRSDGDLKELNNVDLENEDLDNGDIENLGTINVQNY